MTPRDRLASAAAEITPERLALWHDYPTTEAGESLLVNAEWHGPRCSSNRTNKYRDCDCTLAQAVVSVEVEAVIAHRLAESVPLSITTDKDGWITSMEPSE